MAFDETGSAAKTAALSVSFHCDIDGKEWLMRIGDVRHIQSADRAA
jgi:hypothetical protein